MADKPFFNILEELEEKDSIYLSPYADIGIVTSSKLPSESARGFRFLLDESPEINEDEI